MAITSSASPFGRNDRRAATAKNIEYNISARRTVHHRVGNQIDRLNGWMQLKQIAFISSAAKGIGAGIVPNVAPVTPEPTQLHVVAM
jgi:hypothetical protein